jgi:hypothetical protein
MRPLDWFNRRAREESSRHDAAYDRLLREEASKRAMSPEDLEAELAAGGQQTGQLLGVSPARAGGGIDWETPHLTAREHLDAVEGHTLAPERAGHLQGCAYCQDLQQLAREKPEAFRRPVAARPDPAAAPLPPLWQRRPLPAPEEAPVRRPASPRGRAYNVATVLAGVACLVLVTLTYSDVLRSPSRSAEQLASARSEVEKLRQQVREQQLAGQQQTLQLLGVLMAATPKRQAKAEGEPPPPAFGAAPAAISKWQAKAEGEGRIVLLCGDPEWQRRNQEEGAKKSIPFKLNGQEILVKGYLERMGGQMRVVVQAVELPKTASTHAADTEPAAAAKE